MSLLASGLGHAAISERTGVPVETIRTWIQRLGRTQPPRCERCHAPPHDFSRLAPDAYAYVLAVYLGDGWLERTSRSWRLAIAQDIAYPGIIEEIAESVRLLAGKPPHIAPDRRGQRCVRICSYWRQWPCLLPQHGPGRKHERHIQLTDWQWDLVRAAPEPFLRGLIHTDGWRGVNRVTSKGKVYEYPRYQFSNRSADVRGLFCEVCDLLGVEWAPWTEFHISVARRASVARLDEFIGPKR